MKMSGHKVLTTECSKCGAEMPRLARASSGMFAQIQMTVTGYACKECGHWNNLKQRAWFKKGQNSLPK